MRNPFEGRNVVEILWYAFGVYVLLLYIEGPVVSAVRTFEGFAGFLGLLRAVVGFGLVILVFLIPPRAVRLVRHTFSLPEEAPAAAAARPGRFPSRVTALIGIWLLTFTVFSFIALIAAVRPPTWLGWLIGMFPDGDATDVAQALITTFAAGIGACVTSILGYLKHASERKDFDVAYAPWFFARPILGLLLGLIFYFVIKGGLLAIVQGSADAQLDSWALAAIGALVGLFSKNAIEKLREVFDTLFRTERDLSRELKERLPPEAWESVAPYLGGAAESDTAGVDEEEE